MPKTKPKADLLSTKAKGRFRRFRRMEKQQINAGAPLKGTVVSEVALGEGVRATIRDIGKNLTREQLSRHQWRCEDGRVLPITQMRDAHLMNAMDMLTRQRDAASKIGLAHQSVDHARCLSAYRISAHKAQWLMVMEAELLRRHPHYLGGKVVPTKPTGMELRAMPNFFDAGVLVDVG